MANGSADDERRKREEQEELRRRDEAAAEFHYQRHMKDRESLLANEGFAISMQQVVSGALLLGTLSKWDEIVRAFGSTQVLAVVLVSGAGLIAAVVAAQLRHDYRMWNLKGSASVGMQRPDEAQVRFARANRYLRAMRAVMWISTVAICVAVAAVLAGAWLVAKGSEVRGESTSLTARQRECREVAAWMAAQVPQSAPGASERWRSAPLVGAPDAPWANHYTAVSAYVNCLNR